MRNVLWLIPLALANLTGYSKIGVERYCNVNANEKSIQCNYTSAKECMGYAQSGETCVFDAEGQPGVPASGGQTNSMFFQKWQQQMPHVQ